MSEPIIYESEVVHKDEYTLMDGKEKAKFVKKNITKIFNDMHESVQVMLNYGKKLSETKLNLGIKC
jgi:hypothetical protein